LEVVLVLVVIVVAATATVVIVVVVVVVVVVVSCCRAVVFWVVGVTLVLFAVGATLVLLIVVAFAVGRKSAWFGSWENKRCHSTQSLTHVSAMSLSTNGSSRPPAPQQHAAPMSITSVLSRRLMMNLAISSYHHHHHYDDLAEYEKKALRMLIMTIALE